MSVCILHKGDAVEQMKEVPDYSVDLVLTDLPYGLTDAEWDCPVDLGELWKQWDRIVRPYGTVLLFGIQPFTTDIINSLRPKFKYLWYWKKNTVSGALNAYKQPMRCVEEIAVFVMSPGASNAGMYPELREYFFSELKKSGLKRKDIDSLLGSSMSSHYFTHGEQFAIPTRENYEKLQSTGFFQKPFEEIRNEWHFGKLPTEKTPATYNPQGVTDCKPRPRKSGASKLYRTHTNPKPTVRSGFPNHLIEFKTPYNNRRLHPTQKPVNLLEFLIRTHSDEGDFVLDCCMGSGSTGVAAMNTNRNFVGIEIDDKFFEIAKNRIEECKN